MSALKFKSPPRRVANALAAIGIVAVTMLGVGLASFFLWPSVGAQGSDAVRAVIGDENVAKLETALFNTEDAARQLAYQWGIGHPASPWAIAQPGKSASGADSPPTPSGPAVAARGITSAASPSGAAPASIPQDAPPLAAAPVWSPTSLIPLGQLPNEGHWSAYISNLAGQTVAYRTFMQPDPPRPYALAAIVAFDLKASELHFVLGSQEPASSVTVDRTGKIPSIDAKPGFLLAAFNGGFKARHGHFGAMADGTVILPPKDGLGTVAIYDNGRVRIGAWGTAITDSTDMRAWRQNGPLIIDNGQINPHTTDNSSKDWGGNTVSNITPTWRSAIGVSEDDRTLYYIAGPSLTLTSLARAMATAGAVEAMQLDINNYWVHFDSMQPNGAKVQSTPLFDAMKENDNRFLVGYSRDFFYITAPELAPHS